MFSLSSELYDLIYSSFKDYSTETRRLAELIRHLHPAAKSVLDVACGTAEHARLLSEQFGCTVDGIDLDPNFVEIAAAKLPDASIRCADMTDFDLGRRYDVVLCLFSSIGYVRTWTGCAARSRASSGTLPRTASSSSSRGWLRMLLSTEEWMRRQRAANNS